MDAKKFIPTVLVKVGYIQGGRFVVRTPELVKRFYAFVQCLDEHNVPYRRET